MVSASRDGTRTAQISVADQGIGIPERDLERIFERFYRVDPARSRATGGTGLGLAIVKHVMAAHRGKVTVWSQEGVGSTFTLQMPVVSRPSPPRAAARPAAPRSLSGRQSSDTGARGRGRGIVQRRAVLHVAPRGLRGGGLPDRAGRDRGLRPARRRSRAAGPHASRAARQRGLPDAARAVERSGDHADRQGQRDRQGRGPGTRRRRLRHQAVLVPGTGRQDARRAAPPRRAGRARRARSWSRARSGWTWTATW